jgi:enterochelin esterase family protein
MSFMAFVVLMLSSIPASASGTELALGKAQDGFLTDGQAQFFVVSLKAGDFAQIKLDSHGKELVVITYDPSGDRFRGTALGPGGGNFNFVAERSGAYRVDVSAKDKTVEAAYTITLVKVVTLAARLAPPKPVYESPRIKALKASIESGDQASVEAFWEGVKKQGAPLIEPLAGNDKNMLVTFLWRGTPDTHNVLILGFNLLAFEPEKYLMTRLGQTDVWYRSLEIGKRMRFDYRLAPNVPTSFGTPPDFDQNAITMVVAAARPDPLNPNRWRIDEASLDSPEYLGDSFVEMPDAPAQPWLAVRVGIPSGQVERHRFKSTLLKNEREIAVYIPPGYSKTEKPYPLLVIFDEIAYLGDKNQKALVPTPTILDNLISEKRISPMVALLVGNAPGARDRELPCNPVFTDFLVSEVLPWAHGLYNFATDPHQTVVAGSSFGGLAATCAGLRHSETFGNVLSQSGSFFFAPPGSNNSSSETDPENWLANQFIASAKLPLRFYLDAGSDEVDFGDGSSSILVTNRNLRDVLRAKGYEVHFHEFAGGHDYLSWRGTLADGLILLMGNK